MRIIYAKQTIDYEDAAAGSVFLAGPTKRSYSPPEIPSWRSIALSILERFGYDGLVLVPEEADGSFHGEYSDQIEWEESALTIANCILFWVPRVLPDMPALTTNVEFGMWAKSGKVVFGAPEYAEKVKYLRYYAKKLNIPNFTRLEDAVDAAIKMDREKSIL